MLKLLKNRKQEGFTIIEVLIVLAIAGLIIAIVLFAVPALQRNGRNTAIKNDANTIAGQVGDFASNNDGAFPTAITAPNGVLTITGAAGSTPTTGKIQAGTTVTSVTSAPAATAPVVGTINVWLGHKCEGATGAFTPGSAGLASARSVAIYYSIESSGATAQKCIDG